MRYYIDTSSLIKLYHNELGSSKVLEIYKSENEIIISEICKIEFLSAVSRKHREQEINSETLYALIDKFEDDIVHRYEMLKFSSLVIDEAWELLRRFADNHSLKTLDSIQFAFFNTYCESGTTFVCSDKKLSQLVENEGFHVLIP
jgi:uncharacterized protein